MIHTTKYKGAEWMGVMRDLNVAQEQFLALNKMSLPTDASELIDQIMDNMAVVRIDHDGDDLVIRSHEMECEREQAKIDAAVMSLHQAQ